MVGDNADGFRQNTHDFTAGSDELYYDALTRLCL